MQEEKSMNLTLTKQYPTWALAFWWFLLNCCNDGTTTVAAAAAAFAPNTVRSPLTASSTKTKTRSSQKESFVRQSFDHLWHQSPPPKKKATFVTASSTASGTDEKVTSPTVPSIFRFPLPCPDYNVKNSWTQLVPALNPFQSMEHSKAREPGRDVIVQWRVGDNLERVAQSMTQQLEISPEDQDRLVFHLKQCMEQFQSFCEDHLKIDDESYLSGAATSRCSDSCCRIQGFRARIVATRGPSGTKCPRWHVDHVPVRWIQSSVGPGCDFLECTNESLRESEWQRIQQHLENDQHDNIFTTSSSCLKVQRANEQEVALLVGNRWNEFAQQKEEAHQFVPPVLHKSPELSFWQGRVLLTMDVIAPQRDD